MVIRDFHDLVRLLQEHPEWREELRRLVLTEELLRLPEVVARLADRVDALARIVAENTRQLAEHSRQIAELRATVQEHSRQIAELRVAVENLTARMEDQNRRLDRMDAHLGDLRGRVMEWEYREKAVAYFAPLLRRIRTVDRALLGEMADEAVAQGRLSEQEADDLVLADVVLRGRSRETGEETWAVVEVSAGVGVRDVQRAYHRAQALARLVGGPVLPIVAGTAITDRARSLARQVGVVEVQDGAIRAPGRPVRPL